MLIESQLWLVGSFQRQRTFTFTQDWPGASWVTALVGHRNPLPVYSARPVAWRVYTCIGRSSRRAIDVLLYMVDTALPKSGRKMVSVCD